MRFPALRRAIVVGIAAWLAGPGISGDARADGPLVSGHSMAAGRVAAEPDSAALLRPFQREAASDRPTPDDMAQILEKGSSSNEARTDALAGLPLDKLSPEDRRAANEILMSLGLFRRLPTISIECDPAAYDYFIRQPDAAVNIWRVLEISEFRMTQVAPGSYRADAGDGTKGTVRLLHRGENEHLVLCAGEYKSPLLLRPIEARALLHLETKLVRDWEGKGRAVHRLNMFVFFPSQTVETAAKMLSPVSNMVLDRNFREVSLFVHMMTLAMVRQPSWVEQLANRLEDVPAESRRELIDVTAQVYVAEVKRVEAQQRRAVDATPSRAIRPAAGERPPRTATQRPPQPR
ncbi:MAG: hypothetical protein WD069_15675 [Planctomycetales bacterium]